MLVCLVLQLFFLLLLLVYLVGDFVVVYYPLLKRTPNEAARMDLRGEIQHFFLAELLLQMGEPYHSLQWGGCRGCFWQKMAEAVPMLDGSGSSQLQDRPATG